MTHLTWQAAWWKKCHVGSAQQASFAPAFSDVRSAVLVCVISCSFVQKYDDKLLEDHEAEQARLKAYYSDNEQLFALVERREEILATLKSFEVLLFN